LHLLLLLLLQLLLQTTSAMHLTQRASLLCLILAALAACCSSATSAPFFNPADAPSILETSTTSSSSSGKASAAAAALLRGAPEDLVTTCPSGPQPGNPDFGKGQFSQGVSYGIPMMQVRYKTEEIQDSHALLQVLVHCTHFSISLMMTAGAWQDLILGPNDLHKA
jgi:hypothetical protein